MINVPTEQPIGERLMADCRACLDFATPFAEEAFFQHEPDRWSVADVLQHLYLSARSIPKLMNGPREVFAQWGNPPVASRSFDELKTHIDALLAPGRKAPGATTPRPEDMQVSKQAMLDRFASVYEAMDDALKNWSDEELDTYSIPHIVLGPLTVRDMLSFTSIHTQHHLRLMRAHNNVND